MIKGHDILCFAPGPWDDIWRNRHQIMTRLARANRVLYIEPWAYLHPTLRRLRSGQMRLADLQGPQLRQIPLARDGVPVSTNLYVYRPSSRIPCAGRFPLDVVTRGVYMVSLKRVLRRLGVRRPILWLFLPDMEVFVDRFDEKLVIYHIVDEYASYSGVSEAWRPVMRRLEQQLAQRADVVFVTSPTLLESKRTLNQRVLLVPNAVDYAGFTKILAQDMAPPADLEGVPRPIAGYVGAINDKVDLPLLARVASRSEGWSWVLVGPVVITDDEEQRALQALRALPHVYLLGRKNVEEVPRYIAACDVCLLPYHVNEWTRNIDSLKIYEYLACGKAIVATDVPAAHRFSEFVRVARDETDFLQCLNATAEKDSAEWQARRKQTAALNTWEQRVESLSVAIEECLREKGRAV
ncbi:MAG: glycosyltransferase family 1 protein [Chloroflexi bacterium]|nr:glycosyltransferase family 1 protein [Chloroflexota bacterium]